MHTMLGCLLVGLGVDDAFVIVQEFNNAEENDKKNGIHNRTLEERIGRGMKQAGAGITVTSMTDIIVFAIGTKYAFTIVAPLNNYLPNFSFRLFRWNYCFTIFEIIFIICCHGNFIHLFIPNNIFCGLPHFGYQKNRRKKGWNVLLDQTQKFQT